MSGNWNKSFLRLKVRHLPTLYCLWQGLKCACAVWPGAFIYLYTSPQIRKRFLQCFFLNGLLFLGSMFVVQWILTPFMKHVVFWLCTLFVSPLANMAHIGDSSSNALRLEMAQQWTEHLISGTYTALFLVPIYLISFVFNTLWYNSIAKHTYELFQHSQAVAPKATLDSRKKTSAQRHSHSSGIPSANLGISQLKSRKRLQESDPSRVVAEESVAFAHSRRPLRRRPVDLSLDREHPSDSGSQQGGGIVTGLKSALGTVNTLIYHSIFLTVFNLQILLFSKVSTLVRLVYSVSRWTLGGVMQWMTYFLFSAPQNTEEAAAMNSNANTAWIAATSTRTLAMLYSVIGTAVAAFLRVADWLVASLFVFMLFSLQHSFLSFEYRWKFFDRQRTVDRTTYFEQHFTFFLGFGLPLTAVVYFTPALISKGIYALVFPIFIIQSIEAQPISTAEAFEILVANKQNALATLQRETEIVEKKQTRHIRFRRLVAENPESVAEDNAYNESQRRSLQRMDALRAEIDYWQRNDPFYLEKQPSRIRIFWVTEWLQYAFLLSFNRYFCCFQVCMKMLNDCCYGNA